VKSSKHKILSSLFLVVFLTSFLSILYVSLSNSLPELAHFSKTKEIKTNTSQNSTSEDFVFEENETETESEFEAQTVLLPFLISFFNIERVVDFTSSAQPIIVKASKPIYLSVCNFRI
jgi:hypothetical protein